LHLVLTRENIAWLADADAVLFDNILPIGDIEWNTRLKICNAVASSVDLTVITHSEAGYASLDLRQRRRPNLKFGRVVDYLHVIDETALGKLAGYCFDSVRRDAMLDGHAVISEQLRQFLISNGVPRSRIKIVRNAPVVCPPTLDEGLRLASKKAEDAIKRRKIKILFAGRLDYQKGLPRVRALIEQSKTLPFEVEFTIVGKEFLGAGGISLPKEYCRIYPPTNDKNLLGSYYQEADLYLLLSRWEGVPLAILDAMAYGCVVLATDVGAVTEVLVHGENGFLVENGSDKDVVADTIQILQRLAKDRTGAAEIRASAVKTAFKYKWRETASVFLEWMDAEAKSTVSGVNQ
jgi:glycosyltransferase involved in cell wall biosynthesis